MRRFRAILEVPPSILPFGRNHRAFAEVERVMKMENGATFDEFVVLRALRAKGRRSPLLRTVKDRVARCRATSWPHAAAAVAPERRARPADHEGRRNAAGPRSGPLCRIRASLSSDQTRLSPSRDDRSTAQSKECLDAIGAPQGAIVYMSLGEVVWI